MEQKPSLEALTLADIQTSQFYIFGEKLRRVLTWFDPADLRNFEPCPVYEFQGKAMFMNGHTRACAAYRAGGIISATTPSGSCRNGLPKQWR